MVVFATDKPAAVEVVLNIAAMFIYGVWMVWKSIIYSKWLFAIVLEKYIVKNYLRN